VKEIFGMLSDDEHIGVIAFDNQLEVVELLKPKSKINQEVFFDHLNELSPRGGTNMEIGMETAIKMLLDDPNCDRNKRIIFITDDCPNIGRSEKGLREMAENGFIKSNGTLGITYIGVGLTFNVQVSEELSKVRGTTIFGVNSSNELKKILVEDFNYLVSPVEYDVNIRLICNGYGIDSVYGGDEDAAQSDKLLHFRTVCASSVSNKGVKGSAILIKLKDIPKQVNDDVKFVRVEIEYTPYKSTEVEKRIIESDLSNRSDDVISKIIALACYFDVMKQVLPSYHEQKDNFSENEKALFQKLKTFLKNQTEEIQNDLVKEIDTIERLLLI
jgi:Ca-activated chloride channel family protein